jgi:hypothetical protein
MLRRNDPVDSACNPPGGRIGAARLIFLWVAKPNQEKLMDYRRVVRIFLVEDQRLWQEFVVKEPQERLRVDSLGYCHKPHIRRRKQLRQTALLGTSLFNKRSWWALAITLGVLIGFLLVKLMQ